MTKSNLLFGSCVLLAHSLQVLGTCESDLHAHGGWRRIDGTTPEWHKGRETVPCVGPCMPLTESNAPYITPKANQQREEIMQPFDQEWYDPKDPHWCVTSERYGSSGPGMKQWGFCACPKLCSNFKEAQKCKYSLFEETSTRCIWNEKNHTCIEAPNCIEANQAFKTNLEIRCGAIPGCAFINGMCAFLPDKCSQINSIFNVKNDKWKKSCKTASENCFLYKQTCFPVPKTCSEVNNLKLNTKEFKFASVCEAVEMGCYQFKGVCYSSPTTCKEVNSRLTKGDGSVFYKACEGLRDCKVVENLCVEEPKSCSEVNLFLTSNSKQKSVTCAGATRGKCGLVFGVCSTIAECSHYSGKNNECSVAAGCRYMKDRCCSADSKCIGLGQAACRAHHDFCLWKGPGEKKCVCKSPYNILPTTKL